MGRPSTVVSLLLLGGCSWSAVTGPPAKPRPDEKWTCTASSSAPSVDLAVGLGLGGLVAWAVISLAASPGFDCEGDCGPSEITGEDVGLGVVLGALFAAPWLFSSSSGFQEIGRCQEAMRARARWERTRDPLAGKEAHVCRLPPRPGAGGPDRCDPGLACHGDLCVVPPPMPVAGEACRDPIPDVPNTGTCATGLLCRGTKCVPKAEPR